MDSFVARLACGALRPYRNRVADLFGTRIFDEHPNRMNPIDTFLQTCNRDARFICFWALIRLGPLAVRQSEIAEYLNLDRRRVADGLNGLRVLMLAICRGASHKSEWQLSPSGVALAVMFGRMVAALPASDAGEQGALSMYENGTSDNQSKAMYQNGTSAFVDSTMYQNRTLVAVESESVNNINSDSINVALEKNSDPEGTRAQFAAVLKAAGMFANVARKYLSGLEGQPERLPHLLGHLAVIKSGRAKDEMGYRVGAQYLIDCIVGETPADILPPIDLDFDAALRWAMNGGVTDAELAQRAAAEAEAEAAYQRAVAEPESAPSPAVDEEDKTSREYIVWQTVLGQLHMEMSRFTFDTWVRDTRLTQIDGDAYTITAPNGYARDWIENRLTSSVRRALSSVVGRTSLEVRFVVADGKAV